MGKPRACKSSWLECFVGHETVYRQALTAVATLPVAQPVHQDTAVLDDFFAQRSTVAIERLIDQLGILSLCAHRVRWYIAEGGDVDSNTDRPSTAANLFVLAVSMFAATVKAYAELGQAWFPDPEFTIARLAERVIGQGPQYRWDDSLVQSEQLLFCQRTGQSSVLIIPSKSVPPSAVSDVFNLSVACVACIKANAVCCWPAGRVGNCSTCTKNCSIRPSATLDRDDVLTITNWRKSEIGEQICSALKASRVKPPRAQPENSKLPSDPIYPELASELDKFAQQVQQMSANATNLSARFDEELVPLVEEVHFKTGAYLSAITYPTHPQVCAIAYQLAMSASAERSES
ncbi:hypothetical protein EXIGLDRAFT_763583 [Exidia glandulosa HHB12029]|uniref:Uncharacterized protein n=1 Tax=Exidia glandulosa HHB12029 TaxID=1314781 RepID=A0A166B703_EXIGL|nr:hypothetical protein EXIGLDRAFT_763583 [Exidia glandulosa HHB12029]